jgi:glycosyltransferase involved in cell wall biosynthesis
MPLVSVILPVFNGAPYLRCAINSILEQSFQDFELLILDDGSDDGTHDILLDIAARDTRVKVISRENRGLVATLNELLERAQGEFLARMDADDVATPIRLARQVEALQNRESVVLVGGDVTIIDDRGRRLGGISYPPGTREIETAALEGWPSMCHPTFMMRSRAVRVAGGYSQDAYPAEDLDLLLRLAEVGDLENLPEVVLMYRVHPNSISESGARRQRNVALSVRKSARLRRGMPSIGTEELSEDESLAVSPYDQLLRYGGWAYASNEQATAFHYAFRAVWKRPLGVEGWTLLARSAFHAVRSRRTKV